MNSNIRLPLTASLVVIAASACTSMMPSQSPMGFFVTSAGNGSGADFGGLAGADKHCQTLAAAAGAGQRSWRAYLSTSAVGNTPAVDARSRIGNGPWRNAKGEVIASNVDELHGEKNNLTKATALTEKGAVTNGRGDTPNQHDILTGSTPDGRATEATCNNWTSSSNGSAIVGHHDRSGLDDSAPAKSWNSSHSSRACSGEALVMSGGAGLLYCFAAN
jgi:hypothetical protein